MKKTIIRICEVVLLIAIIAVLAVILMGRRHEGTDCDYSYTYRERGKTLTVNIDRSGMNGYLWEAQCSKAGVFAIETEQKEFLDTFVCTVGKDTEGTYPLMFRLKRGLELAYCIEMTVAVEPDKLSVQSVNYFKPEAPEGGGTEESLPYELYLNQNSSITLQIHLEITEENAEQLTSWEICGKEPVSVSGPVQNEDGLVYTILNSSNGAGLDGEQTVTFSNASLQKQIRLVVKSDAGGFGLEIVSHEVADYVVNAAEEAGVPEDENTDGETEEETEEASDAEATEESIAGEETASAETESAEEKQE